MDEVIKALGVFSSRMDLCVFFQELPSPVPVRTRVPSNLFGEALMILEFLRAFGEAFDLKDEFPDGVTLGESLAASVLAVGLNRSE